MRCVLHHASARKRRAIVVSCGLSLCDECFTRTVRDLARGETTPTKLLNDARMGLLP